MEYELTIVIPVYNRAGIVGRTLDSVRHQTLRPLRVVLVDNNSTDETLHVLQAWKEHVEGPGFEVTVVSEPKPGAAAARNRGLREVATPFTMFFDSDDIMLPGHAKRALDAFHLDVSPDIVGWDVEYVSPRGKVSLKPFYDKDVMWHTIMHGSMATQRYAARTGLFREVGEWDELDRGWDDIELGVRLLAKNPSVFRSGGAPTVRVIGMADSITGNAFSPKAAAWERSLDSIERTLDHFGHPTICVDLRRAHLAGCYIAEGAPEEGWRLMAGVLKDTQSRFMRLLLRFACRYTALGGRGVARLLRPFFKV